MQIQERPWETAGWVAKRLAMMCCERTERVAKANGYACFEPIKQSNLSATSGLSTILDPASIQVPPGGHDAFIVMMLRCKWS